MMSLLLYKTNIGFGLAMVVMFASLWGPREHAYCCMEHEGQRSSSTLPTIFCRFACATCKAEPLASLPAPASGSSLATAGSSVIVLPVPV